MRKPKKYAEDATLLGLIPVGVDSEVIIVEEDIKIGDPGQT